MCYFFVNKADIEIRLCEVPATNSLQLDRVVSKGFHLFKRRYCEETAKKVKWLRETQLRDSTQITDTSRKSFIIGWFPYGNEVEMTYASIPRLRERRTTIMDEKVTRRWLQEQSRL